MTRTTIFLHIFVLIQIIILFSGTNARKSQDDEPTDDEKPRQMNWIKLYGKEYYVPNEAKDQLMARTYCKNQKGILFEPKNASVNKDVAALVQPELVVNGTMIKPKIWLGIQYSSSKGQFVYESNGRSIVWKNWKTGQPDGDGRQNCVALQTNDNKWVDLNCNERHVFICERESYGPSTTTSTTTTATTSTEKPKNTTESSSSQIQFSWFATIAPFFVIFSILN